MKIPTTVIVGVLLILALVACGSEVGRKGELPQPQASSSEDTQAGDTDTPDLGIPTGDFEMTPPTGAMALQIFTVGWSAMPGADHYDVWFSGTMDCKNAVNYAGNVTNLTASFLALNPGDFYLCMLAFDGTSQAWKPKNNAIAFHIN